MNYKGFFRNTAQDIVAGLIIALIILLFATGIALAAQQSKPLRDFRCDLAVAGVPVQVEMVKVPVPVIDLGEQRILP
jgi:hypothetical protein